MAVSEPVNMSGWALSLSRFSRGNLPYSRRLSIMQLILRCRPWHLKKEAKLAAQITQYTLWDLGLALVQSWALQCAESSAGLVLSPASLPHDSGRHLTAWNDFPAVAG